MRRARTIERINSRFCRRHLGAGQRHYFVILIFSPKALDASRHGRKETFQYAHDGPHAAFDSDVHFIFSPSSRPGSYFILPRINATASARYGASHTKIGAEKAGRQRKRNLTTRQRFSERVVDVLAAILICLKYTLDDQRATCVLLL